MFGLAGHIHANIRPDRAQVKGAIFHLPGNRRGHILAYSHWTTLRLAMTGVPGGKLALRCYDRDFMKLYRSLDEVPETERGCVLTIGNFDGVHLGHKAIISVAGKLAAEKSLPLVGLTFEPPPVKILRPDKAPKILTPLEIKVKLLAESGLDSLIVLESTPSLLQLSPEAFAKEIIVGRLAAEAVVEGQTFGFGQRRAGTMVSLKKLGEQFGFETHMVPACKVDEDEAGQIGVSSSLIRQQILTCQLEKSRRYLGRYYMIAGHVVAGLGRGRRLGFPTANLKLHHPDQLVPEDGVFAGIVRFGASLEAAWEQEQLYAAAVSIGRGQTFGDGLWQIEAFLLDYDSNGYELYDQRLLVSLVERLRPQKRFASSETLIEAIKSDCDSIRKIFQHVGKTL